MDTGQRQAYHGSLTHGFGDKHSLWPWEHLNPVIQVHPSLPQAPSMTVTPFWYTLVSPFLSDSLPKCLFPDAMRKKRGVPK